MKEKVKKPVPGFTNSYGFGSKSIYQSKCETVELTYVKGLLVNVQVDPNDQVAYEGIRHQIELNAKDLNGRYFYKVPNPTFMRHMPEVNFLKAVVFILLIPALALASNCAFMAITANNYLWFMVSSVVFIALVSAIYWRNGSR